MCTTASLASWLGLRVGPAFKNMVLSVLTRNCQRLALSLRAMESSSTMPGSDSPPKPGPLWSCPHGVPRRRGGRRTASSDGPGRYLPHQYLCCPIKSEGRYALKCWVYIQWVQWRAASCSYVLIFEHVLWANLLCTAAMLKVWHVKELPSWARVTGLPLALK